MKNVYSAGNIVLPQINSKVWKFQDFSVTETFYMKSILGEIISSKSSVFAITGVLNFVLLVNFNLLKV